MIIPRASKAPLPHNPRWQPSSKTETCPVRSGSPPASTLAAPSDPCGSSWSTTPPAKNIAFAVTAGDRNYRRPQLPATATTGDRNYTLIFDTEDLSWSLSLVETVPFE